MPLELLKADAEDLVRALATFRTTMERGRSAWPKDHLLDQIIRQSRQWVERHDEEKQTENQQEN